MFIDLDITRTPFFEEFECAEKLRTIVVVQLLKWHANHQARSFWNRMRALPLVVERPRPLFLLLFCGVKFVILYQVIPLGKVVSSPEQVISL